jgi:hypothetical protein
MHDERSGAGGDRGKAAFPQPRRFNHAQTEALIGSADLPAVWDERDPVCRAVRELFFSYAKQHQRHRLQDEYASLEECSAAAGVTLATLERAQERGGPALDGGKVRLLPFLRWYFENELPPPPPTLTEGIEHGRLQNAILRLQLGCARGRYIPVRHVWRLVREVAESVQRFFARLRESATDFQGQSKAGVARRFDAEAEILEAEASKIDQALKFWRHRARRDHETPAVIALDRHRARTVSRVARNPLLPPWRGFDRRLQ